MQEVDDFQQGLLGFVLAGNVFAGFAGLRLDIDLRVGLSERKRVADAPGHAALEPFHHETPEPDKHKDWQQPTDKKADQRGRLRRNICGKFDAGVVQPRNKRFVRPDAGFVVQRFAVFLGCEGNGAGGFVPRDLRYFAGVHHGKKLVVADFLDLGFQQARKNQCVEKEQADRGDDRVVDQRLF
jgi:hypothetical protein